MTDNLMSVTEVAKYLRVSAITIYRWLEKGQIPAHRVGKQWRFIQHEINEWVKSGDAAEDATSQVGK